jgi:hypothetical protein
MLTAYFLFAVLVFVGLQFWAARGTGVARAAIAVLGTSTAVTAIAAAMGMPEPAPILLFVASTVGMFIVVAPGVWAIRSGLRNLPDGALGASMALLTCATAALGFLAGGLIVYFTIALVLRKCC